MGGLGFQRRDLRLGSLHLHCNFNFPSLSSGFLFGLIFETEDGCDKFLRNITLSTYDTALQPGNQHSLNYRKFYFLTSKGRLRFM
jgi:hypothetical protein